MPFALELNDNIDPTALATVLLALVTVYLAWKTRSLAQSSTEVAKAADEELKAIRSQAEAADRQSKVAEDALNASVRPLLTDVPLHTTRAIHGVLMQERGSAPVHVDESVISGSVQENRTGRLIVPIRNVGAGIARVLAAVVTVAREGGTGEPLARGRAPSVIATGEIDRVWFEDTPGPASAAAETPLVRLLQSGEDLVVEIAYSDLAGRQETATSLYLTESGRTDRAYRVTRVEPDQPRRFTAPGHGSGQ